MWRLIILLQNIFFILQSLSCAFSICIYSPFYSHGLGFFDYFLTVCEKHIKWNELVSDVWANFGNESVLYKASMDCEGKIFYLINVK